MLVAGAKRHAKEIYELLHEREKLSTIYFFDDVSFDLPEKLFGKFEIIRSVKSVESFFGTSHDKRFILGLGNPLNRMNLAEKLTLAGGSLHSVISQTAVIGSWNVILGDGINIMHHTLISNDVQIDTGTLINSHVSVHHDVIIGKYCEVSPHAVLLGGCEIGDFVSIGANATILPNVKIGHHVVVGAGSVVTKDIPDNSIVYGVPASRKLGN